MNLQRILIITGAALAAGVMAAPAQDAAEEAADAEATEETPEQKTARELCTETAAQSVYVEWSVSENRTCQNSFAETCIAIRKADKARFSHACYEPLPPLPPLPGEEPSDEEAETE